MEIERVAPVKLDNLLSDEDTQTMLKYLWELPQEVRNIIFLLFLESSLSYNFTCFSILQEHTYYISLVAFSPDGTLDQLLLLDHVMVQPVYGMPKQDYNYTYSKDIPILLLR